MSELPDKVADKIGILALPGSQVTVEKFNFIIDSSEQRKQQFLLLTNNCVQSRKNIFLDLFNPDTRRAIGVEVDCNQEKQYRILSQYLNICLFLCKDFVVMPPTFALQCPIVIKILNQRKILFRENLIRLPIRDTSFEDFYEKKLREYSDVKHNYPGMEKKVGREGLKILKDYSCSRIDRNVKIGKGLANLWLMAPDINQYWKNFIENVPISSVEIIRAVPAYLYDREKAVTWGLINKEFPTSKSGIEKNHVQKLLQNSYNNLYISEYNLVVISNFPYLLNAFGLADNTLAYDYNALRAALNPFNMFEFILNIEPRLIILVRRSAGYFKFIDLFNRIALQLDDCTQIGYLFALLSKELDLKLKYYRREIKKIQTIENKQKRIEMLANTVSLFLEAIVDSSVNIC